MHGLVNRAIQDFLVETYGREVWGSIRHDAGLRFENFEPMLTYDTELTERVLLAASYWLDRPAATFLEDMGTWLVAAPERPVIRRLLRFGGQDFRDVLLSLDEVPERMKMAIPNVDVPKLRLTSPGPNRVKLKLTWAEINLSAIVSGAIRALADDFGALVVMQTEEADRLISILEVELLDNSFSEGKSFTLGGSAA